MSTRPVRPFIAGIALALAIVLPTVALAADLFTDVSAGNSFKLNIENLAKSGVTAGCTATTYCPSQAVTREQMAAFLNRGLGRVTFRDLPSGAVSTTSNATFGSTSITTGIPGGAVSGATQFVDVIAQVTITLSDSTGCPCTYRMNVKVNDDFANYRVADTTLTFVGQTQSLVVMGVEPVSVSGSVPVEVQLFRISGGGTATAYGQLMARTSAFGYIGTNVLPAGEGASLSGAAADPTRP